MKRHPRKGLCPRLLGLFSARLAVEIESPQTGPPPQRAVDLPLGPTPVLRASEMTQVVGSKGKRANLLSKAKASGQIVSGFEKALAKLPMPVLRTLAAAIRGRIEVLFGDRLLFGGFIGLGCDGSRLECPRNEELQ